MRGGCDGMLGLSVQGLLREREREREMGLGGENGKVETQEVGKSKGVKKKKEVMEAKGGVEVWKMKKLGVGLGYGSLGAIFLQDPKWIAQSVEPLLIMLTLVYL